MKFSHLLAVVCVSLVTAGAQPGTLKQIVPGVWFREGEMEFSHSNNIVIEMKDYLIVVDANYPSGAKAVIHDVKKVSSKPIKYVIDTHADPDHAYGNVIFTRIGATTIAYAAAVDDIRRTEPQTWKQTAGWRKDVAELNLPGPEPPQKLYTKSPYVISDSTRRVELHHFMYGHTRSDTFVYLPKEKILCTGDAVVNGPYSDPKHSYMGNWANEIRAAKKFDVKYVPPGHGKDGGKELMDEQIQFFDELYNAVRAAIKQGKTLDQIVTLKDGRPMATSIRLSPSIMDKFVFHDSPNLKAWQMMRFPTQVRNTYEEIKQGKPWGVIADGN
jgi:cyclase